MSSGDSRTQAYIDMFVEERDRLKKENDRLKLGLSSLINKWRQATPTMQTDILYAEYYTRVECAEALDKLIRFAKEGQE